MKTHKVLVIEPSSVYQLVLQQFLEQHECRALFVKTGQEALELVESSVFDLICVGMELADISGTELCQRIRNLDGYSQSIPIVMVTSNEDNVSLEKALSAGVTEIFLKNELSAFSSFLSHQAFFKDFDEQACGSILYIEDSLSQAALVVDSLESQGHELIHFSRADQALEAFSKNSYDLVLTDIFLEGSLTGLDLIKTIRKDDNNKTPILAMSAKNDTQQTLELLRSGANDYVAKPIIQEELIVRAQNLITTKKLFDTLKVQQNQYKELAMKDQLTGLSNRHFLMEAGPKWIKGAQRNQHELSMLVVDLDKFKLINDTHGHATGDIVLESVGSTILDSCRGEDIACRFGGEEFVLVLPHCDIDAAKIKAELLRKAIAHSTPAGLEVTASIGVSSLFIDDKDDDFAKLFARADHGTYQAKDMGRNQVVLIKDNLASN